MDSKKLINALIFPSENIEKLFKALQYFVPFFTALAAAELLYAAFGILWGIIGGAVLAAEFFFLKLYEEMGKNSPVSLLLSALIPLYFGISFYDKLAELAKNRSFTGGVLETICLCFLMFFILSLVFGKLLESRKEKADVKAMGRLLICAGAFFFTVLVYLPCDTYINNLTDFNFPLSLFIFRFIGKGLFWLIPFAYFGLVLSEKAHGILCTLFCGLTLCAYAQYMFMNSGLGLLMGESVNWDSNLVFGIANSVIWAVLLILPFMLRKIISKLWRRLSSIIPAFLGGVQLLSLVVLIFTAGGDINIYRNEAMDGREQYTVSSKKNIITFVFDAVDNYYFEQFLEDSPEVFEGFEDFTLYNNTCSVHDYTLASMTQMLAGETSCPMYDTDKWLKDAWNSERAGDFYKRLHDAGYTVNAYMHAEAPVDLLERKYDNCFGSSEPNNVDKEGVYKALTALNRYRYMPYLLKRFFDTNDVDFKGFVEYNNGFNYENDDYFSELKKSGLKKSGNNDNYFIVEHLNGAHYPCDDIMAETKKCLEIAKEYIKRLKDLGVYENSAIIITSDHGRHTSDFSAAAPTPIFMVKEAGQTGEEMKISTAPVYHADFLATYLKMAGLYGDTDKEAYGSSVFDFKDGDIRSRTWYDHTGDDSYPNPNGAACNVYFAYTYEGTEKDLREITNSKTPTTVVVKE